MARTDVGDSRTHTFKVSGVDEEGNSTPADPETVSFRIRRPDGTESTVEMDDLENPTTGTFTSDVTYDQGGRWFFRWESTEPTEADEYSVWVRSSVFESEEVSI